MSQYPQKPRARITCTQCHEKKIKCDLEANSDEICSNCRRAKYLCFRRESLRTRRKGAKRREDITISTLQGARINPTNLQTGHLRSPAPSDPAVGLELPSGVSGDKQVTRFIADHSLLNGVSPEPQAATHRQIHLSPSETAASLGRVAEASALPKQPLLQGLIDSYFENLYHFYPVVDQSDISDTQTSELLLQALCMAGSLMRHVHNLDAISLTQSLYEKTKELVHLNHEQNPLTILKATSLMGIWSSTSPDNITLDGSWHWIGVSIRLAVQMGLHKESTYANKTDASCRRRVWWQLLNRDKVVSACWGRPVLIKPTDTDVRLPTVDDFECRNIQAQVFVHYTKLHNILGHIAELGGQKREPSLEVLSNVASSLQEWLADLPDDLQFYDSRGKRQAYNRSICELHIIYFACIILAQSLWQPTSHHWRISLPSIVASSCMVRIFEEIHCHDQSALLLPINAYFALISAIPHIYYRPYDAEREESRKNDLNILFSVLNQMKLRYDAAASVLNNIARHQEQIERTRQYDLLDPERSAVETGIELTESLPDFKNLFPFPLDMCSNMDLLSLTGIGRSEIFTSNIFRPPDENTTGTYNDDNLLMEIFGMNVNFFDYPPNND